MADVRSVSNNTGYDDLPSRDAKMRNSPAQPPKQLFSATKDGSVDNARSRLIRHQTQA